MPASTREAAATSPSLENSTADPLSGVDTIIVIDNGAHNIRIASIPYPLPTSLFPSSSWSSIDTRTLLSSIPIEVYPNAIARTRMPHTIPSHSFPTATAPAPGTKTSIFVSSHIHSLLDDYAALHLRLPHQSGVIVDWAAQKRIWDHVLTNHLVKTEGGSGSGKKGKGKLLAGKAVVITEAYLNPEPVQSAIDLMLFEQYGTQAVWRTTSADLIGVGSDVFSPSIPPRPITPPEEVKIESTATSSSSKPPLRPARSSDATEPSLSRISFPSRPQSLLVVDLGYSFCHAIPIINSQPHTASIRRLELGGKMLTNLLKETLSFGQLDMMDESWLMSHIFARTSFVAAEVGRRVYGGRERVESELERIGAMSAGEWSYEDLLLLEKYRGRYKEKGGGKQVRLEWRLPDYGGNSRRGERERERARYGFIVDGPNPAKAGERQAKRQKLDKEEVDWDSAFIASSSSSSHTIPKKDGEEEEEEEEREDLQSLTLSSERFSILENLFNPSALSLDQKPLPELILDSITSLPASMASAGDMMWSNIVLTGGLSNAVGMKTRLEKELRPLAPSDVPVRILPDPREDRSLLPIQAGVLWAVELSAREALRRDRRGEQKESAGKKGARKGKGRGGGRKSVSLAPADREDEEEERGEKGRWMTYAQWSNPPTVGGAAAGEVDIVKAANSVFYPATPAFALGTKNSRA
ncbi:hypothetical protein NDA11_006630 [Ustilago hordei]|nr:uncharacterized protein UHO2_04938 [Ustilago hordei]KAJ1043214.1 hypothetical protein NDA10_000778 [Ustilago hordei]KAJ1577625.1 hypothetical protein NDA11_006630 [Ustilago hordei]KAJ1582122.1 hypothetical protein NDA15_003070 [Ustilago hordei]KAJ1597680.1 hypothetical protein NDA14_000601 [Ustilago hordei]SYW83021.1 related to ARP6 - Actin-related protein [Ustilago hordei]